MATLSYWKKQDKDWLLCFEIGPLTEMEIRFREIGESEPATMVALFNRKLSFNEQSMLRNVDPRYLSPDLYKSLLPIS